jgi:hypothetical protein
VIYIVGTKQDISSKSSPISAECLLVRAMPSARSEIAGAALNVKICVIGGFDETGKSSPSVKVYDPSIDEWWSTGTV